MAKESPILFSEHMVKAILDRSKTMTRRVIKNQDLGGAPHNGFEAYSFKDPETLEDKFGFESDDDCWVSPYGGPGDFLWVRETFGIAWREGAFIDPSVNYKATLERIPIIQDATMKRWQNLYLEPGRKPWDPDKWKPSIFLPKWACRIWLKIACLRVERLQDISEEDAEKEGIDFLRYYPDADETLTAKELFMCLWDSINGKPRKNGQDISWDANPWVWAPEFEITEKPISTTE